MPRPALSTVVLIVAALLSGCQDRRADKAFLHGDYQKSVAELQSLANIGEPRAQYDLALLYDQGLGVPQSDTQAFHWYSRAAEHGDVRAQYNLGLMYMNGQGMAPDLVQAYYWLSLALAGGEAKAPDARDYLLEKMSPGQIQEGNNLVRHRLTTGDQPAEPKIHYEAP
ncbi:MAG TPA: tetratricopeptide repeat protein [Nitrospira sp.]|nr:tetratricopeptide repeat protein [Nitrospira sp.]